MSVPDFGTTVGKPEELPTLALADTPDALAAVAPLEELAMLALADTPDALAAAAPLPDVATPGELLLCDEQAVTKAMLPAAAIAMTRVDRLLARDELRATDIAPAEPARMMSFVYKLRSNGVKCLTSNDRVNASCCPASESVGPTPQPGLYRAGPTAFGCRQ